MSFISGWSTLIKRLVGVDAIFGVRTKKITGIFDVNNVFSGTATVTPSANTIAFTDALPAWVTPGKWFKITAGGGQNENAKFRILSVTGNTLVTEQLIVSGYSGPITLDGRIGTVIGDRRIAGVSDVGATYYRLGTRDTTDNVGDGSGVSLAVADHYHDGDIITHMHNSAGHEIADYDAMSGEYLPRGPQVVYDNNGRPVRKW